MVAVVASGGGEEQQEEEEVLLRRQAFAAAAATTASTMAMFTFKPALEPQTLNPRHQILIPGPQKYIEAPVPHPSSRSSSRVNNISPKP